MENTIVLYPSSGIGHLVSMVELGKLILTHYSNSFSIIVLISRVPLVATNNQTSSSVGPKVGEKSGTRFLWVVRNPPPENRTLSTLATQEPTLESFLLEGFLERTKDKGFLVKNWAPQVEVLSHESVGGFVTHCGWNSILEATCAGVPMVAWPLYDEQKLNRVYLAEELRVALSVTQSEDGFVSAQELEERVSELMNSEKGKGIRERVMALKGCALEAMKEGGSSRVDLARLVESLKRG